MTTIAGSAQGQRGRLWPFVGKVLMYLVLILGAVSSFFPFYWMISSSFKITNEIMQVPPNIIPTSLVLDNYIYVFSTMNVWQTFLNSLVVSGSTVLLNALFSGMVAYALVKLVFPGRKTLFMLVLAFMMIPGQLMTVPLFLQINNMGLLGTYPAMILPGAVSSFSIFLFRQAMLSVPNDYIDAAKIDGSSHVYIFFRIILPLIVPTLITVVIINFFWSWNSYLWPMMVTVGKDHMATMPVALDRYRTLHAVRWGATMAGCVLTAAPIMVLYLVLQRQFIESIALSGIKG